MPRPYEIIAANPGGEPAGTVVKLLPRERRVLGQGCVPRPRDRAGIISRRGRACPARSGPAVTGMKLLP